MGEKVGMDGAPSASMLIFVAVALLIGWVLLKVAWGVASFGVHVLLGLAVLAALAHFIRGRFGGGRTADSRS